MIYRIHVLSIQINSKKNGSIYQLMKKALR